MFSRNYMKQILILIVLTIFTINLNGQNELTQEHKVTRSNGILVSTLVGSSKIGFGIRYKSLYNVKKKLRIGWGVGVESYSSDLERNFIPLSFEVLGDVAETGGSFFYMLSMGYGIPIAEDSDFAEESNGGLMVDVSVGYRSVENASQPFFALGYRFQNASYSGQDVYGNNDKEVLYKRLSFSAGIFF